MLAGRLGQAPDLEKWRRFRLNLTPKSPATARRPPDGFGPPGASFMKNAG